MTLFIILFDCHGNHSNHTLQLGTICNDYLEKYRITGAGLILSLRPANERRRYKLMPSPIGWAQTRISPVVHNHMASCISVNIGSGNRLSPIRHQAIITWTNADSLRSLEISVKSESKLWIAHGKTLQRNLNESTNTFSKENVIENAIWPFCSYLNVLT